MHLFICLIFLSLYVCYEKNGEWDDRTNAKPSINFFFFAKRLMSTGLSEVYLHSRHIGDFKALLVEWRFSMAELPVAPQNHFLKALGALGT